MSVQFRLLDFNVFNEQIEDETPDSPSSDDSPTYKKKKDTNQFIIQLFGLNDTGKTYCIYVDDFKPYFYMKVGSYWNKNHLSYFKSHLQEQVKGYYADSILKCELVKKRKLYGFDNNKEYSFVYIEFANTFVMNKVKNLFYYKVLNKETGEKERKLLPGGYYYHNSYITLYEANIPPLLRCFHIQNISPSGWIKINKKKLEEHMTKTTTCDYEFTTSYENIIPMHNKETPVPYKICSFDIEASSSHGDFPIPIKTYKKLVTNILDYWDINKECEQMDVEFQKMCIKQMILRAFNYYSSVSDEWKAESFNTYQLDTYIEFVYPKCPISKEDLDRRIDELLKIPIRSLNKEIIRDNITIHDMINNSLNDVKDGNIVDAKNKKRNMKLKKNTTLVDLLNIKKYDREDKLNEINRLFIKKLPKLEGDKVTFIGSTFMKYGDDEPYFNHCIALDTCDDVDNAEIERYDTEREVLLAWTKLIQRENPDIIIGYNIFGFDYSFMFYRAKENYCLDSFIQLSRNKDEYCCKKDYKTKEFIMEQSKIVIASGAHNLNFIKIPGRIQIDLYNFFRREYNLSSYKLDYVSGHFIGDKVKKIEIYEDNITEIISSNLTGLSNGNFIHFEEIGHSSEYYKNGAKFEVFDVNEETNTFWVKGEVEPDMSKVVKWCLAKDDVTPQDIFRMTNEGPKERAVIAKYCIQDCNLVQHLLKKIDVITGFIEMAKICSVPIYFLVMRGQGIKLFSFISKRCREVNTLIPVLEKKNDGGYEGAIVLDPKCGLYLDEPVACVDYSSLYPSSMISENLSHDSKVWSREYDLNGELVKNGITGVQDDDGTFIYDNLPGYKYIDIKYDTYEYLRKCRTCSFTCKTQTNMLLHMKEIHNKCSKTVSAANKTHVGSKICRFAQFPDDKLAIMPDILKNLLDARKATRASAMYKTIKTITGDYIGMVIEKTDDHITLKNKKNEIKVIEASSILSISDTYNQFMKNVLDKRQLAIKLTANSLYGQCGARTSSFYEKDVAASTTATGRKLLTYGKRIIEEVYGDKLCTTKYGTVQSNAEYIYGDTDSIFMSFKLTDPTTGEKIVGKDALKHTIELAKEAGELATNFLKAPHDLEYEKTFMPFCLLSKKRYVGMLYEHDINKCYRKSMGIVLKRRDNAPIVKDVYGGIIDILMKEKNITKAIRFTQECMQNIVDEKYPIEKLIITKSLRGFYKNPKQIAHKVLAERMGKRDPGNKPSAGDRIPFVYIEKPTIKGKKLLQGERVEHPSYIKQNKIRPDYSFYITNQIMKPVQQVFALVLENIPGFSTKQMSFEGDQIKAKKQYKDKEKYCKKVQMLRNKIVKELLFNEFTQQCENIKAKQKSLADCFTSFNPFSK